MLTNNNTTTDTREIILTAITAKLRKNKRFWDNIVKPSPFAIITVDGNQIKTTKTKSNTSNPKWNEQIILNVSNSSVLSIELYDEKKWKQNENQGFLGAVTLKISKSPIVLKSHKEYGSNKFIYYHYWFL